VPSYKLHDPTQPVVVPTGAGKSSMPNPYRVPTGTKPYGEGLQENMVVTEAMREFNGERYNKW
jgi:hypothetical protein